jgi:hypothetical protein
MLFRLVEPSRNPGRDFEQMVIEKQFRYERDAAVAAAAQ